MKLSELELYFETFGTANEDIEIMPGVYILALYGEKFVESTIKTLKAHPGNMNYKSYYDLLLLYYNECFKLNKNEYWKRNQKQ